MTQELWDLRKSILEGRYKDALVIVDELEVMSRKSYIRNIRSYLIRLIIHLIKNQVEQRLTNSWAASIECSILEIQDLNLQDNSIDFEIDPPPYLVIEVDLTSNIQAEGGSSRNFFMMLPE